jgi:hypothetical protein
MPHPFQPALPQILQVTARHIGVLLLRTSGLLTGW